MNFLVHLTCSPSDQTKAALAFLVAKTAADEGHTVALFLAGDSVELLKDEHLRTVTGLGTGRLEDHFNALTAKGARFYLSGMSSKARGVTEEVIKDKPAEFAMPVTLIRLAAEADRIFTY